MPELGALIARGRTADVHAWSPGQVLKLYRPGIDLASVEQEALVARLVHAADARTPAVGDIVVVAGRFRLAYEQIEGIPMSEVLLRQPWRAVALGKRLARLHVQVHALAVSEALPSQYVQLVWKIERADGLSKQARQAALTWLADARQGSQLCHGDFHPGNVLLGTRRDTSDRLDGRFDWATHG